MVQAWPITFFPHYFAIHFLSHLLFDFSDVSQTSITGEQCQLLGTVLQRSRYVFVCLSIAAVDC